MVQPDSILVCRGGVDKRGGDECNLIVNDIVPMEQLDVKYTTGVQISIDEQRHGLDGLQTIYEIVRGYPGSRELEILIQLQDGTLATLTSHKVKVDVNDELKRRVEDAMGQGSLQYKTEVPKLQQAETNGYRRKTAT